MTILTRYKNLVNSHKRKVNTNPNKVLMSADLIELFIDLIRESSMDITEKTTIINELKELKLIN